MAAVFRDKGMWALSRKCEWGAKQEETALDLEAQAWNSGCSRLVESLA